jgi:hypothetical protein
MASKFKRKRRKASGDSAATKGEHFLGGRDVLRVLLSHFFIFIAVSVLPYFALADSHPQSMRSIAEQELSVSELASSNTSQLSASLDKNAPTQRNAFWRLTAGTGNLQLSGRRNMRSFRSKDYGDLQTLPFYSLRFGRQAKTQSQILLSAAFEFGLSSEEFEIRPLSGVTSESARLNSLVLGGWFGAGIKLSQDWDTGLILGYRKWSFQQSASSQNGVFTEEADTLHYGVETRWWMLPRTAIALQAFASSAISIKNLNPNPPVSAMIHLTRAL